MEDLDTIEESYEKQIEDLDKSFLEKFKDLKKDSQKESLEKSYQMDLLKIKQDYEKRISQFLKKHKSFGLEKEEEKKEEDSEEKNELDMSKPFRAVGVSVQLSGSDLFKQRMELFKFREGIKTKKFFEKATPRSIQLSALRLKFFIKGLFSGISRVLSLIFKKVSAAFIAALDKIKESLKKVLEKIKLVQEKLKSVKEKFSKKKKKKEGDGKGEEGDSDKGTEEKKEEDKPA